MKDDETAPCRRPTLAMRLASGDLKATAMTGEKEGKVWAKWKRETCCLLIRKLCFCSGQSSQSSGRTAGMQKGQTEHPPRNRNLGETEGATSKEQKYYKKNQTNKPKRPRLLRNAQLPELALPGSPFLPVSPSSFVPSTPSLPQYGLWRISCETLALVSLSANTSPKHPHSPRGSTRANSLQKVR